jgi:hypothetical protein
MLPSEFPFVFFFRKHDIVSFMPFHVFVYGCPFRLLKLLHLKENCVVLRQVTFDTRSMERLRESQVIGEAKNSPFAEVVGAHITVLVGNGLAVEVRVVVWHC